MQAICVEFVHKVASISCKSEELFCMGMGMAAAG